MLTYHVQIYSRVILCDFTSEMASYNVWILYAPLVFVILGQIVTSNVIRDDDQYEDDENADDYNYYGDDVEDEYYDDDEDEFGYGDVYTFDDDEETQSTKYGKKTSNDDFAPIEDAEGGLHFRSNKVRPAFMDQENSLELQDDHKEYSQSDQHPGAGYHNGHDTMDKTHANLIHDDVGVVRDDSQTGFKVGIYDPDFDDSHVNHIPAGYPGRKETKPKQKKPQQGGGYRGDSHPYGGDNLHKPKPPFIKALPVRQDHFGDASKINPAYYDSEEKSDGLHFASSYKNRPTGNVQSSNIHRDITGDSYNRDTGRDL